MNNAVSAGDSSTLSGATPEQEALALQKLMITEPGKFSQNSHQLAENVHYLGYFMGLGEIFAKQRVHYWRQVGYDVNKQIPLQAPSYRSLDCQRRILQAKLETFKDCIVFSSTPTYYSQYLNACLLKEAGFKLVGGQCAKNPAHPALSQHVNEHPGIAHDKYWHWEHLWMKVIGEPKRLGAPMTIVSSAFNNCGLTSFRDLNAIKGNANTTYLAVGWLPRGTLFPEGWKRFYSAEDYKLGINFSSPKVASQKCPHKFDLAIFEDWKPDFAKWTPA